MPRSIKAFRAALDVLSSKLTERAKRKKPVAGVALGYAFKRGLI